MEQTPQHIALKSPTIVNLLQNAYRTQNSDPNYTLIMIVPLIISMELTHKPHIQVSKTNNNAAEFIAKMFYLPNVTLPLSLEDVFSHGNDENNYQ